MKQDLAFGCESYEEYSNAWDRTHPSEKKVDNTPVYEDITITYPDGHVAKVSPFAITIAQLVEAYSQGADILL